MEARMIFVIAVIVALLAVSYAEATSRSGLRLVGGVSRGGDTLKIQVHAGNGKGERGRLVATSSTEEVTYTLESIVRDSTSFSANLLQNGAQAGYIRGDFVQLVDGSDALSVYLEASTLQYTGVLVENR